MCLALRFSQQASIAISHTSHSMAEMPLLHGLRPKLGKQVLHLVRTLAQRAAPHK